MKISEVIKHLEYQKEIYGDSEVAVSISGGEMNTCEAVLTKTGDLCFTYFQVNKDTELLIIGDKDVGI